MHERRRHPELMDHPGLDGIRHVHALQGLARLNGWSLSGRTVWHPLARLARDTATPLRVLDLACGGGDNTIRIARRAERARIPMQFDACDISERALDHAAKQAARAGVSIRFYQQDVLSDPIRGNYDAVMSSLFLHHLADDEAVAVLAGMARAADRLVLVTDLVRSRAGLGLAHLACRLLTRSEIVRYDGPQSVRSAFTIDEARQLAARAGLAATVRPVWPERFVLTARLNAAQV